MEVKIKKVYPPKKRKKTPGWVWGQKEGGYTMKRKGYYRKKELLYKELDFSEENISEYWKEVKDWFWEDLRENNRWLLKKMIEEVLESRVRIKIGVGRYERGKERKGYRNGYYRRNLETGVGYIEGIKVPRTREGGISNEVFRRYQRRKKEVEEVVKEVFLRGVSTRNVGKALKALLGKEISAQTVSNICKKLNREIKKFHERKIEDEYIYLIVDGIHLKVKDGVRYRKRVVLCAYGVRKDGRRELIDFMIVQGESETAWEGFLGDLYRRGLEGKELKLIVSDGSKGLEKALEIIYPRVLHQRCWRHKMENVANKIPRKWREECVEEAKKIYQAGSRKEAVKIYWEWAKKWREKVPKAVNCLEKDLGKLLHFYKFPQAHWKHIRTTNILERAFREVRRRVRPISCFTNRESCERVIYGVISNLNKNWEDTPIEFTQNY